MPFPVVRANSDLTTGHSVYDPTTFQSGSENVFVNNLPVVRQSDPIDPHPHDGGAVGNQGGVMANNLPIQHVTNEVDCGDHSAEGSPDTFIC
jgi:uncharacterized Zn-binding protein involved in type VI secretion